MLETSNGRCVAGKRAYRQDRTPRRVCPAPHSVIIYASLRALRVYSFLVQGPKPPTCEAEIRPGSGPRFPIYKGPRLERRPHKVGVNDGRPVPSCWRWRWHTHTYTTPPEGAAAPFWPGRSRHGMKHGEGAWVGMDKDGPRTWGDMDQGQGAIAGVCVKA